MMSVNVLTSPVSTGNAHTPDTLNIVTCTTAVSPTLDPVEEQHKVDPLGTEKSSPPTTHKEETIDVASEAPKGYSTLILGVHRVIYSPPPPIQAVLLPGFNILESAKGLTQHVPSVLWLYREIYYLDRISSMAIVTFDLINALTPTLSLYIDDCILKLIETGYKTDQMDVSSIGTMLGIRTAVSLARHLISYIQRKIESKFKSQVTLHFRYLRLQAELARLRGSLPEGDEGQDEESLEYIDVWRTAEELTGHGTTLISTFSECALVYKMLSGNNGNNRLAPILLGMWILRALPTFDSDINRLWSQGYLTHVINKDYLRMKVVKGLVKDSSYRESVVSLNLAPWVLQEFQTCMSRLRGVDLSHFYQLMWGMQSPFRKIISGTLDQAPTLYYIFSAMFGWSTISFATVSSVQSSSYTLRWRLKSLFGSDEDSLLKLLARVHKFFTAVQVGPEPDENAVSYPDDASTDPKGMAVEFRNVTFNYSGSKAKQPAINDISFSILPGQLIVIVGANGSGKTSMVKLLTRVHEPNTGTIIIDGHSAEHFKHFDLREATAVLSQDHTLFGGVSIAEDVGLGRWKAQQRRELIEQALHLGGATHLLSKLNAGSDTVLSPVQTKELGYQITNGPLKRMHDKIEKESSVSGGEKQRLVAARTFMRMNTGNVKLVVVDEPSAAMDPAGEFELFKHLREARQGKTMIFITHRFGHLTKHADAIFCMKDGELVERGTHAELVARKGEYYNLYNIQAQAFAAEVSNSGGNEVGEAATAPRLDISS